jgi:hypothetical protein
VEEQQKGNDVSRYKFFALFLEFMVRNQIKFIKILTPSVANKKR